MRKTFSVTMMIIMLITYACTNRQNNTPSSHTDKANRQNTKRMNSHIAIFEIAASDISRAIHFYETVLDLKIEKITMPGMEMGLLPYKDQMVTGVIIKAEGYAPSPKGVTIYLNAGNDLQVVLDKIEKNGGKIVTPKTPHADENGYFALFLDSEGNRIGLHSPN
ncbi:glyoxalase [marine bacterium AO1-C]|nr:glyoxalase [marine bacterium AO1-C]